jgi:hypothetical protein
MDYLGLCTLQRVYNDFTAQDIIIKFAAPKSSMLHLFENTDFYNVVPRECVYATVKLAVESCHRLTKTERSVVSLNE